MAYQYVQLILFIFLFSISALAQNNGTVPLGSILTASETSSPWLSPSGDFAFGFQQLQDKDLFLLSIWFHKIPDKTVVWYVKSTNPVPRGSTVELDSQPGLVLRDPGGVQLWSTNVIFYQVDLGFMDDTGNFILKASDDSRLWESFKFPTDTILPKQTFAVGNSLNSRWSETNFSQGRFYLHFLDDRNLVLANPSVITNVRKGAEYYKGGSASDPGSSVSYPFVFDRNNQTIQLIPLLIPLASENYHRATLDFDGVFRHYYHPRNMSGNPNWNTIWFIPENICTIGWSGACGFNNICNLDINRRPVCECPEGYMLLDPDDKYGSCKPNSSVSCDEVEQGSAQDLYDFVVINDIDWPFSDFQEIDPSNESVCRQACLEDCFCAVAIFRYNKCWKKMLPLFNGRVDTSLQTKVFIKYRKRDASPVNPNPPSVPTGRKPKGRGTLILVGSVLLGTSFLVNLIFITTACLAFYLIYLKRKVKTHLNTHAVDTSLRCFGYKELAEATNGFEEELGRGAFGIVYKGELQINSKYSIVAVKKLDRIRQDAEKEFRAEVNTIGQTNHKNLVRLLGFCDEGQHRLLVYEYMSRGTLAELLLHNPKPIWKLRTHIAIGIARGLAYLHEECTAQIIHRDIKPENILLDEYFNPRISDFGLAKMMMIDQSRTVTDVGGTKGYLAPEWFRKTPVTPKVDVYSFGVVLLEIISCRRSVVDTSINNGEFFILTDWAWDCFAQERFDIFVGNDLEALNDRMMLERFMMVAIWCIQENPSLRPTMMKVSQMLEGIVEVMLPSSPSPFSAADGD